MILRTDHVAGGVAIAVGVIVYALSGDLPTGRLSMPGAGMLPKLVCAIIILFGAVLVIGARRSAPFAFIDWSDIKHAAPVVALVAAAVALYTVLGFIITFSILIFALLCLERRHLAAAAGFAVGVSVVTYFLFSVVLRSPLEPGLLWF